MIGRRLRIAAVVGPVLIVAAMATIAVVASGGPQAADFELRPVNPGGPVGLAHLEQDGERVRGRIAVWGLAPGSRHLAYLTGPSGACRSDRAESPRPVAVLPELVADPNGVAFARVSVRSGDAVVKPDFRLTVFSGPRSLRGNVPVTCGNVVDGGPLRPAELAGVGPGAGARSDASSILQLRDGRPIGGPQRILVRRGGRVALAVRSDLPDEVTIAGVGLTQQVGPGTIARFSFAATRAGRFAITARTGGRRPVATLEVSTGAR